MTTLPQPLVVTDDDGVRVCFPSDGIGFTFEEFRGDAEHADMTVHYLDDSGQVEGRIHGGEIKLSGVQSRGQHVKVLDTRADQIGHDWAQLVEAACLEAKTAWRRGTPAKWLDVSSPAPPVQFTVDRLVIRSKVSIFYGAGGIGKGYLLGLIAVCVTHGLPVLGLPVERGRVLYLDWEDEDTDCVRRIREISRGLGITPAPILYARQQRPLRQIIRGIIEQVRAEGITLVIIDSATGAGGEIGDHGYEGIAQQLFAAAKRLPCTVIVNDHVTDEGRKGKDLVGKPYGSVRKRDLARAAWELRAEESIEGGPTRVAAFHTKHNHTRRFQALGVEITHEEDECVRYRLFDVRSSPTLATGLSKASRTDYELQHGALTLSELATRLDENPRATYMRLSRAEGKRYVCLTQERMTDGALWGMVT